MQLADLVARFRECEGWAALREAARSAGSGSVDGAWGSAAAAAMVALAQELTAPLVVLLANPAEVTPWLGDVTSFLGAKPAHFPAHDSWPPVVVRGRISDETSARLRVLQDLAGPKPPKLVLASMAAVMQPVPVREDLAASGRKLVVGESVDVEDLVLWLHNHGYKRVDAVEYPGEFSKRGGILDLFPPDALDPVRVEFFGDEIESLRSFATSSQRSLSKKTELTILQADRYTRPNATPDRGFLTDYLPKDSVIALVEPGDLKEQGKHFLDRAADPTGLFNIEGTFAGLMTRPTVIVTSLPRPTVEAVAHLRVESVERFSGNVSRVKDELDAIGKTDRVVIACQTEAEIHRLQEVLKAGQLAESQRLELVIGHVRQGFRLVGGSEGLVVLGSHQIFHRDLLPPGAKANKADIATSRRVEGRAIDSFLELNEGDYVVHVAHGIAKFRGMRMLPRNSIITGAAQLDDDAELPTTDLMEENLILEFRDAVCLYVPASRIDLVQRYVGGSQVQPELSKLGGTAWQRKKDKVSEALRDMAADMIQLQAVRNALPGMALPIDSDWQKEFEDSFPFQETPDQLAAIQEIKADQQKPKPMDRLLCGDVGYGKTEVAIRAAFKAIDNGKQVAVLVPTTVLAEQHYRTFTARLAEYPFTVEVLSRFKSAAKQKEILKRAEIGGVDVLIGTHRVVSKDVKFKDLGLVIIDEEQRFGVEHKERLKLLRTSVDVLTMTATPIPRTLHSALLGIREISNLETPPPDRVPVETRIIRWDDQVLRHAINREFNRGGQVYFVHNRVHDIQNIAAEVQAIVPEAKIVIGHGQMNEHDLEKAMVAFVKKEADILVATTIIESGLDIPNANTMIINEADIYGLADLHQLRGRVGRTKLRAYAYLIVDANKLITPTAQKRLKAIEEFTELGSGFKISMRDLEIRGAGNLLGQEQSGHIAAIGYEMYCTLLENAVRQLNQQPPKVAIEVNIDLPWPAFLPRDYVPGQKPRIEVYRRLARLRDAKTLADFRTELTDRYGTPPQPAEWLLKATEVRILCVKWQVTAIHRERNDLVLTYRSRGKAEQVSKTSAGRLKVVDDKSMYLRIRPDDGEDDPEAMYQLLTRILGSAK
ncbi:MAG: transcription-repair coupling factor [Fimbriiglobus sp.]